MRILSRLFNTFSGLVLALICLFVILFVIPSFAGTVSLQPVYDNVVNPFVQYLMQGVALAVAGWFAYLVQRYAPSFLKPYLETQARDALNTALQNGVQIAMHQVESLEGQHSQVEVKGMIQKMAVQYAVDHAPDAISHFGLDPTALAVKALAYIPSPSTTTDTTGVTITTSHVDTSPLPPVGK